MLPDLVIELARHPGIVGVKEASGDIGQISRIIEGTLDEDFQVISGDDNLTFPILALGGNGVISVAANVEPGRMVAMFEAFCEGDFETALDLHYELSPLFRSMFIDTNPIPVKKAVELRGMAAGPVRLPLDELDARRPHGCGRSFPAMINVVVCGALGRMGMTVGRLVNEAPDMELVGGIDLRGGSFFGVDVTEASLIDSLLASVKPDVLIDFTAPAASVSHVKAAARSRTAAVVGTTGFSPEQRAEMAKAIEGTIPAVISSNFSIGVNIFWNLLREAARMLPEYDVEVLEAHHRYKKDAPSGTAKTILQILDEELGPREKKYGREGMMERGKEIGVHVIRGGDIVGDHSVLFSGNFETIELSHRAYDRTVFAHGALKAARWVVGKKPGLYGMNDVLDLR